MIKKTFNNIATIATTLTLTVVMLLGATIAQAQSKPVLVVSLPSIDELMANLDFLGSFGGQPAASQMVNGMVMGMTQGQNWNLEDLSADCASDGRYSFFLDASPMPLTNAVGSPVNPVVVK